MTLAQTKTKTGRWSLAAALLTGAALCAPLSVADPVNTSEAAEPLAVISIMTSVGEEYDEATDSYTYYKIEEDGSKTTIDEAEFRTHMPAGMHEMLQSMREELTPDPALEGEPGLSALQSKTVKGRVVFDIAEDSSVELGEDGRLTAEAIASLDMKDAVIIRGDADHAEVAKLLEGRFTAEEIDAMMVDHLKSNGAPFEGMTMERSAVISWQDDKAGVRLTSRDGGETFERVMDDGRMDTLSAAEAKAEHGLDVELMRTNIARAMRAVPPTKEIGVHAED